MMFGLFLFLLGPVVPFEYQCSSTHELEFDLSECSVYVCSSCTIDNRIP